MIPHSIPGCRLEAALAIASTSSRDIKAGSRHAGSRHAKAKRMKPNASRHSGTVCDLMPT
jgi:hypothetical protein